jgi:hypothetical protein
VVSQPPCREKKYRAYAGAPNSADSDNSDEKRFRWLSFVEGIELAFLSVRPESHHENSEECE